MTDKKTNITLWNNITIASGVFAFIVSVLLIANYLQTNRIDPVNTEIINALVQRLSENPMDELLREQIREMDLLARKAYFTNRWQIRTGGLLLVFSLGLIIFSMQMVKMNEKLQPVVNEDKKESSFIIKEKGRKLISITGMLFVLLALVLAFLSSKELENKYNQAAIIAKQESLVEEPLINNLIAETHTTIEKNETVESISKESDPKVDTNKEIVKTDTKQVQEKSKLRQIGNFPTLAEMKKNFPSFRGVGGNGIAYQKNIPTDWNGESGNNIRWKVKIPLHGYNSPIVWNNKVFISGATAEKRQIFCYATEDGQLLWTANVEGIEGSPDKSPDVSHDTGHAAATLTTDGVNIYAIFSNGDIIAVNFEGNKVWSKNLGVPSNHYGHSSSLLTFKDLLIVQYDHKKSAHILALETSTGDEIWKTKRQVKVSWASPILANTGSRDEVILVADPFVASYDPATGKELWSLKCMTGEVGPSAAYSDGIVYALNEYASLVAIKIGEKAEILWEDYEYLSDVPSPIVYNGLLFVATSYGLVICMDAKTGEKYWEQEMGNGIYASPILAEDKLYLIDNLGIMHIFKAEKQFVSIAVPQLGENTVCTPAFSNGRIFVRTDNNLICIGK